MWRKAHVYAITVQTKRMQMRTTGASGLSFVEIVKVVLGNRSIEWVKHWDSITANRRCGPSTQAGQAGSLLPTRGRIDTTTRLPTSNTCLTS
jgi:hypothetical protein